MKEKEKCASTDLQRDAAERNRSHAEDLPAWPIRSSAMLCLAGPGRFAADERGTRIATKGMPVDAGG